MKNTFFIKFNINKNAKTIFYYNFYYINLKIQL